MSENQKDYSEIIKVILLGETNVGKTCLINAYFEEGFTKNIHVENNIKFLEIKKKNI